VGTNITHHLIISRPGQLHPVAPPPPKYGAAARLLDKIMACDFLELA